MNLPLTLNKEFGKLIGDNVYLPKPKCKIRASNDAEAMQRWLDEYFDRPATFRTYKKEAERFLVWLYVQRNSNLTNFNRDDVESYINFLKNPQPREKWCGPARKKNEESSEKIWHPFRGPLSFSAIKACLTILNSFFSYLVDAGYLEFNAFSLVRKKSQFKNNVAEQSLKVQERILDDKEWKYFLETLHNEPENTLEEKAHKYRLVFLIYALFYLGLRIDELSRARWNDFRMINSKWWFFVVGKGNKLGKIPVNRRLLKEIISYRHFLGLDLIPNADEHTFIFQGLKEQNLSTRQMSNLIKSIAIKTAAKFENQPQIKQKLEKISPHWLRHLSASKQDLAGISFTNIQQNLRHQNEQTTRQYIHSFDDIRHQEMENLKID